MSSFSCHDCGTEVPGGEAIVRSVSFRQVAFCRDCWDTHHATPVPSPRASVEDAPERERV